MVIGARVFGVVAVLCVVIVAVEGFANDGSGALQDHFGVEFVVVEHPPALGIVAVAVGMSVAIAVNRLEDRLGFIVKFESFGTVGERSALDTDGGGGFARCA